MIVSMERHGKKLKMRKVMPDGADMHLFHGRHLGKFMYARCKRVLCASVVQYV